MMDSFSKEAEDPAASSSKKVKKYKEDEMVRKDCRLDCVGATKITDTDLKLLETERFFSGTKWWVPCSEESFIHEHHPGTVMALHSWFEAGLCVPIHPLISALMREYGFDLAHLHPTSMLYLNIFRWLCETTIRQEPTLPLLLHFFEVSINDKAPDLLFGSVVLKFRRGMIKQYPISPSTSPDLLWEDWTNKWFYLMLPPEFHHPAVLPSLRHVVLEKPSYKDQQFIEKLEEVRSQRSVRDMLEEMLMAGTFRMFSYSPKQLGLSDSICPPRRCRPTMSYAVAKDRANKLIGPYTTEEHNLYLKEIGGEESPNLVGKRFKLKIPLRTDPALGPQLYLPDGMWIGRMATCSREPVGSSQRNEVGAMPDKEVAMRTANTLLPEMCKNLKRKSAGVASALQPAAVGVSTLDMVIDPESATSLPPAAFEDFIGRALSGDIPIGEVPPMGTPEKEEMNMWVKDNMTRYVNVIIKDICGDGNLVPALLSPIGPGKSLIIRDFRLESDERDNSIQDEIHVSKEKTLPGSSDSDSQDTMEWLGSLSRKGDVGGDSALVVQAVQRLAARAEKFTGLIKKVEKVKKRANLWNKAYMNSMEQLEVAKRDHGKISANYMEEKKKTDLVKEKLKKTVLGAEQIQLSLKQNEDKVVTLEKEKESLQKRTNAMEEDLVETSKEAKMSKEALAEMRLLVNTLKEDLKTTKEKTDVPREPSASLHVGPQAEEVTDVPHSLLSVPEAEIASRIHSIAKEVHLVLKAFQADGLISPPPPCTASEACNDLAILVAQLEAAARIYSRTLAAHALALGVATVVDKDVGWAGLQGKVPASAKTFLKKENGLLPAAMKFVETRDPNKADSI